MTLPSTGAITIAEVATELGLSQTGLSLNHSWVRSLAGAAATGGVDMNDLHGQNGFFTGAIGGTSFNNGAARGIINLAINFVRGTITSFLDVNGTIELSFSGAPNILGSAKIYVFDNTTGGNILLSQNSSTLWEAPASGISGTINIQSTTENYTFTLHT